MPDETAASVEVEMQVMGELVTGLWCSHCALPSAVAMAFGVRPKTGKGSQNLSLQALYRCVQCGANQ